MSEEPVPDNREVTLIGGDGTEFTLPFRAAIQSELVKDTFSNVVQDVIEEEDDDDDEDANDQPAALEPMELKRVCSATLEKIVEFLKHHYEEPIDEIPHPLPANSFEEVRNRTP